MDNYLKNLCSFLTPGEQVVIDSRTSTAIEIKPGKFIINEGLAPRHATLNHPLDFNFSMFLLRTLTSAVPIPWATLTPKQCPLSSCLLRDISGIELKHPFKGTFPLITCGQCSDCPDQYTCQGTAVGEVCANSKYHNPNIPQQNYQKYVESTILKAAYPTILKGFNDNGIINFQEMERWSEYMSSVDQPEPSTAVFPITGRICFNPLLSI